MLAGVDEIRLLALEKELFRLDARDSFPVFLNYVDSNYNRMWFHTLIADKCQHLIENTLGTSKLMLFVPPQHGKSEIVSRKLSAWVLGKNPRTKIVGASYSADIAEQFCTSIQRTIDSTEYSMVFPDTYLSSSSTRNVTGKWMRRSDFFETVKYGGFYKAVGVCGSLTGTPADLGIIDDPVKDPLQAFSPTYRQRVWDWYVNVFLTRLHNDSKILLIMTRWHSDDLAGRLLDKEGDTWTVVNIPAIREDLTDQEDPRQLGEALWEDKHSLKKLNDLRALSERTFTSLYQQRPVKEGGNIIKQTWFRYISQSEFNRIYGNEPIVFFMDTAYTEKSNDDPSGIIATCKIGNDLYITHGEKVNMEFPDLIRFIPEYARRHGYMASSTIRIEPKANGLSVIQQLKKTTGLRITCTPTPTESKETRLNTASPNIECGRVIIVNGAWNESFVQEICGFPAMSHDEYVDLIGYAIGYHLDNPFKPINLSRLNSAI